MLLSRAQSPSSPPSFSLVLSQTTISTLPLRIVRLVSFPYKRCSLLRHYQPTITNQDISGTDLQICQALVVVGLRLSTSPTTAPDTMKSHHHLLLNDTEVEVELVSGWSRTNMISLLGRKSTPLTRTVMQHPHIWVFPKPPDQELLVLAGLLNHNSYPCTYHHKNENPVANVENGTRRGVQNRARTAITKDPTGGE